MDDLRRRDEKTGRLAIGRLGRRALLKGALGIGVVLPALPILAACGGDEATPTQAAPATATPDTGTTDPTPTEDTAEATPTAGAAEATPTETAATPTTAGTEATPTGSTGGTRYDGGDRLMGQEFEEGRRGGHLIEGDSCCVTTPFNFSGLLMSAGNFQRTLFEGLIEPNPFTFESVGLLAEAWEVAGDGLSWTFFVRQGVTFHDGETLTAEDVAATYSFFRDETSTSTLRTDLQEKIAAITVVDDYTITFETPVVIPDFLWDAAMLAVGAAHILAEYTPDTFNTSPAATGSDISKVVGTGPFKASEVVLDDHVTMVRFDHYWDGAPYLDAWTFRVFGDDIGLVTAMLTGEIDYLLFLNGIYVEQLEEAGIGTLPWQYFFFDCIELNLDPDRTTLFQDQRVRQALMYALDRQAIADVANPGFSQASHTLLMEFMPFGNPDGVTVRYDYDPERAMALLDEAGWVVGADGIREKDGQRLSFSINTEAGWHPWESIALTAAEFWRLVGVEATVDATLYATMSERRNAGDFEATVWALPAGPTHDHSSVYLCGSTNNPRGYCNPEVDQILTEARSELDQERRIELYTEFQNLVLADLPFLPLFWATIHAAASPRLRNIRRSPNTAMNSWYAAEKIWIEE